MNKQTQITNRKYSHKELRKKSPQKESISYTKRRKREKHPYLFIRIEWIGIQLELVPVIVYMQATIMLYTIFT